MDNDNTKRIIPVDLGGEMQKSFISYAMAVIMTRALPDVRDGLKPVQRRILYSMNELGVTSDKAHKKCARIVGDTMGKYHPHGDSSIYDALVRMAQDFSMRYMLVDGHGNFGTIDGDGAAAMRYTEARLAKLANEMLRDIDKDTVDFCPNFDESLQQPVTLPARFPQLLVNGTGGIAVGMATNIPPHNLGETIDATCAVMDNPDIDIEDLMEYIPAPDFPTGGLICGISGVKQAYRTGRGKIRLRARAEIDTVKDHESIIVTEIPFQVNKEQLVASMKELVRDKKIDGIADVVDESAEDIRIVIDLKRGVNSSVILNRLYKHTQMQTTFGVIMLALVDGAPKVLNIKQVLSEYIKYQEQVITRRTRFDLEKAKKREHIVEGLVKALNNIDAVIQTIKESKDGNVARVALMEKFGFTEIQAQAILDMRLQRLTGLEVEKLEEELKALLERIEYYNKVLANESMVKDIIKTDLLEIKDKYGDARRTTVTLDEDDVDLDELIQEEDMVVTLTHQGYIKRCPSDTYKSQKRGGRGVTGLTTKDEDFPKDMFVASTHTQLMFFTTKGKVYIKKCYMLPEGSRTAKGSAIVNFLNLDGDEKVSAVFPVTDMDADIDLLMITKNGTVKKTALSEYRNIRQNGIIAMNIRDDDELIEVLRTNGDNTILLGTHDGMGICFHESDVRRVGRTSFGVRGITLREGDYVVGGCRLYEDEDVLTISENGYGKRTPAGEYHIQSRGGMGSRTMRLTDKTGAMTGIMMVDGVEDVMLVNDANVIIRICTADVSTFGKSSQGVRLMRLEDDIKIAAVAKLPAEEKDDEEETEE